MKGLLVFASLAGVPLLAFAFYRLSEMCRRSPLTERVFFVALAVGSAFQSSGVTVLGDGSTGMWLCARFVIVGLLMVQIAFLAKWVSESTREVRGWLAVAFR